jgi:HlyD family secretion protein
MGAKRANSWVKIVLLVIFIGVATTGWVLHSSLESPVGVRVVSPSYQDVANLVTTNGQVEPTKEFQARANFPGMVEKVPVELGAKVNPGQLLVTMKDPYAVSRVATAVSAVSGAKEADENIQRGGTQEERIALAGDLEHAKLAQSSTEHSLQALEKLQREGAASTSEVDAAQKKLADANATLATLQQRNTERYSPNAVHAAQAKLADAEAALGAAKISFANANISSPMSGTVYSVSVSPYDFVPLGADLLRVADLTQMQIRAYFDEPEVGKLKADQPVSITWDGRPGITWHGHIREAPVAAQPMGTRSVAECLITVDDAKGDLLPNTHVVVTVPIEKHLHVLTVPRPALQAQGGGNSVFRVVNGRLVRTPVNIGLVNLDLVEIVEGLSPQDVVAVSTENEQPLSDHLAVKTGK